MLFNDESHMYNLFSFFLSSSSLCLKGDSEFEKLSGAAKRVELVWVRRTTFGVATNRLEVTKMDLQRRLFRKADLVLLTPGLTTEIRDNYLDT